MKRRIFIGLISLLFVVGIGSVGWAANNTADTSQLGSLLIFPKVIVAGDGDIHDTIIQITNTANQGVDVKCYWLFRNCCYDLAEEDPDHCGIPNCPWIDFELFVTKNDPVWFRASDGTPAGVPNFPPDYGDGELKCFAVNQDMKPIKWNYLKGEATIMGLYPTFAGKYNAWSFQVRGAKIGQQVGEAIPAPYPGGLDQHRIYLSGRKIQEGQTTGEPVKGYYDSCPKFLHVNFFANGAFYKRFNMPYDVVDEVPEHQRYAGMYGNVLGLVPCKQDFTNGAPPTVTKLEFDIYNEAEIGISSTWDCMECYYEEWFDDITEFTNVDKLQSDAGYMRVYSVGDPICDVKDRDGNVLVPSVQTGLVGVHLDKWEFQCWHRNADGDEVVDFNQQCYALTATNPFGSGRVRTDTITYTPGNP